MIIGASPEADGQILRLTQSLYRKMDMKRVYYSSYVPVVQDSLLPDVPTGQLREHRLYQADWLLRFYGFTVEELLAEGENLSTEFDPKCAWALKNMHLFPVEINRAPLEMLLRVPGIGSKNAYKIMEARKYTTLTFESLTKMRVALKRAKHFITCNGKFFGEKNETAIRGFLSAAEQAESAMQMDMFSLLSTPQNALIALHGQL
jgi:predicted DNA-binding helix-hairpin-helix protein